MTVRRERLNKLKSKYEKSLKDKGFGLELKKEVPKEVAEKVKKEIRRKMRRERVKTLIIIWTVTLILSAVFIYFFLEFLV